MKYIIISFFLLWITSCSTPAPDNEKTPINSVPKTNVEWSQISDSGVSVSDQTGTVSIMPNGNMQVDGSQGSAIYADTGAIITSGGTNITAGSGKISVGTGIQISPGGNMEKDPEIESITQDIDKIFSDIENEGK